MLVRLGLGSGFAAGLVVTVLAATTAVAVLVTMRALGAEQLARRAAPFLAFGPAAVWQAVSADAMFAAVGRVGHRPACAVAATRRSVAWSVLAGLLLGCCVMMSYGLPLLGVLAVAVLVVARSWFPLVVAAASRPLAVVGAFAVFGFNYLEALPAIHERYCEGVGGRRPAAYWMWGDLAALAFSAGPLAFAGRRPAGLGVRAATCATSRPGSSRWLSGAGVAMVLLADLSQMSKAEVERIWLPFVPWVLVSCALLPERVAPPRAGAAAGRRAARAAPALHRLVTSPGGVSVGDPGRGGRRRYPGHVARTRSGPGLKAPQSRRAPAGVSAAARSRTRAAPAREELRASNPARRAPARATRRCAARRRGGSGR